MAWKARVTAKTPDYRAGEVVVSVDFFDDASPLVVLHTQQFRFSAFLSANELVTAVKKVGAEERRKRTQVLALHDQINVGAEIVV